MDIIEHGRAFVQSLRELARRTAWDWKRCPQCGSTLTIKNGGYLRHPWFFAGRQTVRVQRHLCHACHSSYSEQSALLVGGSWYAREVRRAPWIIGCMGACRCAARRSFCARGWGGRSAGACGGRWMRCLPRKPVIWQPVPCTGGWMLLGRWPRRVCRGNCRALRRARSWGRMACGPAAGWRHPGGVAAGR